MNANANQAPSADIPRVTETQIDAAIARSTYFYDETLTICVITLVNGFKVVGESACAHPALYNQAVGEKIAFQHARNQLWKVMGYALRDQLHRDASAEAKLARTHWEATGIRSFA
jgi:hypothetical protein